MEPTRHILRPFSLLLAFLVACATAGPPALTTAAATAATAAPVGIMGCHHQMPPSDGGAGPGADATAQPTGTWEEQVQLALDLLGGTGTMPGGVDLSITVIDLFPISDLRAKQEALDTLRTVKVTLLPELRSGLAAWRSGDQSGRCRVWTATRAIGIALRGVAVTIAAMARWNLQDAVHYGMTLAFALTDQLNPTCQPDAGWSRLARDSQQALAARNGPRRDFPTVDEARRAAAERR
jgi:hypothetical protein